MRRVCVCVFVVKCLRGPVSERGVMHVNAHVLVLLVFFFLFALLPYEDSAEGFRSEGKSRSGYHEKKVAVWAEVEKAIPWSRSKRKRKF